MIYFCRIIFIIFSIRISRSRDPYESKKKMIFRANLGGSFGCNAPSTTVEISICFAVSLSESNGN